MVLALLPAYDSQRISYTLTAAMVLSLLLIAGGAFGALRNKQQTPQTAEPTQLDFRDVHLKTSNSAALVLVAGLILAWIIEAGGGFGGLNGYGPGYFYDVYFQATQDILYHTAVIAIIVLVAGTLASVVGPLAARRWTYPFLRQLSSAPRVTALIAVIVLLNGLVLAALEWIAMLRSS